MRLTGAGSPVRLRCGGNGERWHEQMEDFLG
jgi:hypothetical protein